MICAGDYSGDKYGGGLAEAIKVKRPRCRIFSLGGRELKRTTDSQIHNLVDISIMGFWEPLLHIRRFKKILDDAARCIKENDIKTVVLIDYYGFNIHLARRAFEMGAVVFYFVSPQIWASRYGRIKNIKKYVKKMFVIFPFEEEIYNEEGVPVEFVGHPLSEVIGNFDRPYKKSGGEFKIGILPGSRKKEVSAHIPVLFESAATFNLFKDNARFFVFLSSNIPDDSVKVPALPGKVKIETVREPGYELRSTMDMAWSCSGTATLENAFLGLPTICFYRTSWVNYFLASMLVNVDYIAMPNILAGRELMPELIQIDFNSHNLVRKTLDYAASPDELERLCSELKEITGVLRTKNFYSGLADRLINEAGIE